ncbi:MAG: hypothetical protein SGJ04_05780 [Bacteroidota bacterium]|nr:hypothetical protein [Bacteroidota bacterium]
MKKIFLIIVCRLLINKTSDAQNLSFNKIVAAMDMTASTFEENMIVAGFSKYTPPIPLGKQLVVYDNEDDFIIEEPNLLFYYNENDREKGVRRISYTLYKDCVNNEVEVAVDELTGKDLITQIKANGYVYLGGKTENNENKWEEYSNEIYTAKIVYSTVIEHYKKATELSVIVFRNAQNAPILINPETLNSNY